jgi:transposase
MTEAAKVTWQKRVARWKASGETADAFAAREGIKAGTLRWWSSRLQRDVTTAPGPAPVRMVQLVRVPSSSRATGVIVDLPDTRARVIVEPGFDRETLARVLELLGRGHA